MIKKKIVLIGPAHPIRGGIASFNDRLAQEYYSLGYEIIVYTFSLQYPDFLFPGSTQYSSEPAPTHINIHAKINSLNPYNWWRVGNEIKKLNPAQLIIAYWLPFMAPCLGSIARIVRKNRLTEIVCIAHNIVPHEKRIGDNLLTKYFVKAIDKWICMSSSVQSELKKYFHKNSVLVPHPIYDNYGTILDKKLACHCLSLPVKKYVLFFGLIRKYKGLDLLLQAMADTRIKTWDIHCIIAGEFYEDITPYLNIINKNKLQDRITIHDQYIDASDIPKYFSAADIVVLPYRHATQSGVTQLAYHFEKPMIVTATGGLHEMVIHEETGYVVDKSPQAIADAIIRYYTDIQAHNLIDGIKAKKKEFTWQRLVEIIDKNK